MAESAQEAVKGRLRDKLSRECGTVVMAALADPAVVEVMLNPDGQVWVDRHGEGLSFTGARMPAAAAESMLATCAAMLNTTVHYDSPILEGEFPLDGSRLQGLLPPVVRAPAFAIRKRTQRVLTLDDFQASGILGAGAHGADALRAAVRERHNILIVGGTGSGKTTLANAVLDEVARAAPGDRLVAIEDTMELQVNVPNHVLLRSNIDVDMQRLLRATMRLRPDRIVVGEVRGGEALTLLKSWNTGHPGGLATIHANSAQAGLLRLCQLIREAPEAANLSEQAVGAMVAEAVHVAMFIQRIAPAPGRRVSEIVRVRGFAQGRFEVEPLVQQPQERSDVQPVPLPVPVSPPA